MELTELIARELDRFAPDLSVPELQAITAATVAANVYRQVDGKLVPTSREAVAASLHFLPPAFVSGISGENAARMARPHERVIEYFRGIGSSFDAALDAGTAQASALTAADVADVDRIVDADAARGNPSLAIALKNFTGHRGGSGA